MSFESVACCDDCWWNDWTDPQANGRGFIDPEDEDVRLEHLQVRFPTRVKNEVRSLERCHFCGFTTLSGIWVRSDAPASEPREREEIHA